MNSYKQFFTTNFAQYRLLKDKKHYINYACTFAENLNKQFSIEVANTILNNFMDWAKYVEYQASIDHSINNSLKNLSYKQFKQKIFDVKKLYAYPNELYSDDNVFCGEFKEAIEAQMYPIPHIWCVQRMEKNTLKAYQEKGSRFFIIRIRKAKGVNQYVLAEILKGDVKYHTTDRDILTYENTPQKFEEYERSLPQELKTKLYNIAAGQTEKMEKESHVKELYNSIMRDVAKTIKEHLTNR